jgi:hypothetical protein
MARSIVFSAALAQRPRQAGLTWVFLQYLLGFRRLGWEVLLLDRLEPSMCVDQQGRVCPFEQSLNVRYFLDVMRQFGFERNCSLWHDGGKQIVGLSRREVLERVRESEMLLNVMGYWNDPQTRDAARRRVFLDIDPGFGQMWQALGLHDPFVNHDAFVTVGYNIGRPDCTIPTCGCEWIRILPPVVLSEWPAQPLPRAGAWTSIASWRGDYGPIEYQGKTYGLRVHEFRKFFELPRLTNATFELAMDLHPADAKDAAALDENGWRRTNPVEAAATPDRYREFIAQSLGEFMVAKNLYVQSRSGWFSDRSVCYLASGRPVIAQDTGLDHLPDGAGLLRFTTLEEAAAAVREVTANPLAHSRAARAIAQKHFDSDKVLARLMEQLEIGQEKSLCPA